MKPKQALVIIDYINSCCLEEFKNPDLNIGLTKVREMEQPLQELISYYRKEKMGEIIWITCYPWTKDYVHPNIARFYEEYPCAEFYDIKSNGGCFYKVIPESNEKMFAKNNYSAFSGTEGTLDKYLKKKNINNLMIAGIYSTGCVNATIVEAFHLGYKLTIVEDCVETFDCKDEQEYQYMLLSDWRYMYGTVATLLDIKKGYCHP